MECGEHMLFSLLCYDPLPVVLSTNIEVKPRLEAGHMVRCIQIGVGSSCLSTAYPKCILTC